MALEPIPLTDADLESLAGVMYLAFHQKMNELFGHIRDLPYEPWEWVVEHKANRPSLYDRWMGHARREFFPEA